MMAVAARRKAAAKRARAAASWAARRHRPLEALLCAACLAAGAGLLAGAGAALLALGALFFIDLAADARARAAAARRPRR